MPFSVPVLHRPLHQIKSAYFPGACTMLYTILQEAVVKTSKHISITEICAAHVNKQLRHKQLCPFVALTNEVVMKYNRINGRCDIMLH